MLKLLALLLPLGIDHLTTSVVDTKKRFWISAAICSLTGVFLYFVEANFNVVGLTALMIADGISDAILIVFGLAQLSFHGFYKETDTHKTLDPRVNS